MVSAFTQVTAMPSCMLTVAGTGPVGVRTIWPGIPARETTVTAGRGNVGLGISAAAVAVRATQPRPGAISAQPAPQPALEEPVVESPAPRVPVAPEPEGAAESRQGGRARAAQLVGLAAQQVDRLRRMEKSDHDLAPREDVDGALSDLEIERENVLQDLRELELRPAEDVLAKLEGDVAHLQNAIRATYGVAPPPSQGLPQPIPLPPSQAW